MSSGPYPPMTNREPVPVDPDRAPVLAVQLAGWHWPLRLRIERDPGPDKPAAIVECGRGMCRTPLVEIAEQEMEGRGWAFDPAEFTDYAATHLPACKSGTVRHIF